MTNAVCSFSVYYVFAVLLLCTSYPHEEFSKYNHKFDKEAINRSIGSDQKDDAAII